MKKLLPLFFIFGLIGCILNQDKHIPKPNDTAEVLRLLLDSAIIVINQQNNPNNKLFSDSIVMLYDSLYTKHLPKNLKFKIMTEDEICSYATEYESGSRNMFPDVVVIKQVTKTDSGYLAHFSYNNVLPFFDKNGKPYFNPATNDFYKGKEKCQLLGQCKGGYTIEVIKKGASLLLATKN